MERLSFWIGFRMLFLALVVIECVGGGCEVVLGTGIDVFGWVLGESMEVVGWISGEGREMVG